MKLTGNLYDPRYDRTLWERIVDAYDNPFLVTITMVLLVLILMLTAGFLASRKV